MGRIGVRSPQTEAQKRWKGLKGRKDGPKNGKYSVKRKSAKKKKGKNPSGGRGHTKGKGKRRAAKKSLKKPSLPKTRGRTLQKIYNGGGGWAHTRPIINKGAYQGRRDPEGGNGTRQREYRQAKKKSQNKVDEATPRGRGKGGIW